MIFGKNYLRKIKPWILSSIKSIVVVLILLPLKYDFLIAQVTKCQLLCNVDFEDNKLVGLGQFGFFKESLVSCWNTTASDKLIEIWGSGFGGVPAYSGNQFAELNANMVSTLYQNFTAGLGGEVEVSFAHRGRAGVDVLTVEVGPIGGPYDNLGLFSADNKKWEYRTVRYKFPASGQSDFTIRFRSVSAAGGATVGNFLDAISVKLIPPKAILTVVPPTCPNSLDGSIVLDSLFGYSPFLIFHNGNLQSGNIIPKLGMGLHTISIEDIYGCHMDYFFDLTSLNKNDSTNIFFKTCSPFYWELIQDSIYTPGIYKANLINQFGCDSLVILNVDTAEITYRNISIEACEQFHWDLSGEEYLQSGIYVDTILNSHGCDSIVVLDLVINKSSLQKIEITSCDSFYWPVSGKVYKYSGKFRDTLQSVHQCDSILELNLIINNSIIIEQEIKACDSYYWSVSGRNYMKSGTYFHYGLSTQQCDSIQKLNLIINKSTDTLLSLSSCDSLRINDVVLRESQLFPFYYKSARGCDSVVQILAMINHSSFDEAWVESCNSYYWICNDSIYMLSGQYYYTTKDIKGCDSIRRLNVIINPNYLYIDTVVTFEEYYWSRTNQYYKEGGQYSVYYTSSKNCDSIYVLVLIIKKKGEVWIPNVFSPNGDLVNDYFVIFASPEINEIKNVLIFDRWGALVYSKEHFPPNDESVAWNGRLNNKLLNPGVYAYVVNWVDQSGKLHIEKGNVTLVR